MSLFDRGPSSKVCFIYCGDDHCNCWSAPRYRHLRQSRVEPNEDQAEVTAKAIYLKLISHGEIIKRPIKDVLADIVQVLHEATPPMYTVDPGKINPKDWK